MPTTVIALVASLLAVVAGFLLYRAVLAAPATNARAREIASAIAAGAQAFLSRQYRTVLIVGVPIFFLLGFLIDLTTLVYQYLLDFYN